MTQMSSNRQQHPVQSEPPSRREWLATTVGALLGGALWLRNLGRKPPRSWLSATRTNEEDPTQHWLGHD